MFGTRRVSMDCSRCEATLRRYELDGRRAQVCEQCGYVGVDVEHRDEPVVVESWEEALRRFRKE